jgi:hypothetical protein
MFIDLFRREGSSLQRSEIDVRPTLPLLHRAPLERPTLVGSEVYKHLAPLEPEPMTELNSTASILQR